MMNKHKKLRVLFIEDNILDQRAFKEAVQESQSDFEYDIAGSIKKAKTLLVSRTYDMVVADFSLGDGNAFDIIPIIKDIPFIITTGNGDEEIASKALKLGAFDYIAKDFDKNYAKLLPISIMKGIKMQETQKRLNLFEASILNIYDGVVIAQLHDEVLKIQFVNQSFTEMTGYSTLEAMDKSLYFLTGDRTDKKPLEAIKNAVRRCDKLKIEIQLNKKNLQTFWASISLVPLLKKGEIYYVANIRDISETKRVEEELRTAKLEAEKARLTEQRFLVNMSHHIRTPMHAILGMSHLLSETELDKKQKEYLKALKYSGDNLMNLISDVLDLTKIQANEIELANEQFNLFELLLDLQRNFTFQQKNKNISVVIDLDISITNDVLGDFTRLRQILTNLLSNAAKFTQQGEIGIKVSRKEESDDNYLLEFQVFDTGIGMSDEELENVFEKFTHANEEVSGEFGGSGLGLSIAQKLTELLGGQIWIKSQVNQGTVVHFVLPLGNSGVLSKVEAPLANLSQTDDELLQSLKILVAEDNLMNQKLISGLLSRWKCHFDLTNNGVEAVEQFEKKQYDVVFMDINMPKMNGYEAARAIRNSKRNYRVPIVALTAAVLSTEKEKVFISGMNEYVAKPFNPKKLKEIVLKLIRTNKEIPEIIKKAEVKTTAIHKKTSNKADMLSINFDYLKEFSGGDIEFVKEMVNMFVEQIPEETDQMSQLLANGNWEQVGKLAHKMKPNFLMMGMEVQKGMAKEIEHMCKESDINTEKVKTLALQLINDAKASIPIVQAEVANV